MRRATAPAETKRPWWLIAVGLAAALGIAIATLPARFLAGQLPRAGLGAVESTGSVWSGHARGLTWRAAPLGDLRWSLAPPELLRGRVAANLHLTRPDGESDHPRQRLRSTARCDSPTRA